MLVADNLSYRYPNQSSPVLEGVSLTVSAGERVVLHGPSGVGKTTLAKLLAGYEQPQTGTVTLDGKPLPKQGYCPVQMVWQHPEKSVNPLLPLASAITETGEVPQDILDSIGVKAEWLQRRPAALSGGEIQRCCIVRALGPKTTFLIADEITTMLDSISQAAIWNFLLAETERRNIGMLIITHDDALADRVATRRIELVS
ncbi:oligopeptide ABC transporter ATP-binding protein [Actinobaculum suis]|uniref:Oligopeptide ABC transporter ATP-binding protein n=1 Tax=Actinobaculum suis TaxID=1657 RepID=A0A7Z8YAJ1_9ACTO|nr:oligopeptide ABC transporter ATP-binding protein [Actinobaculum suis]